MADLNHDISQADRVRALHRVVRAMHDGHCPKCGHLGSSESFRPARQFNDHVCPRCDFEVTEVAARLALDEFQPYLDVAVGVFEEWSRTLRIPLADVKTFYCVAGKDGTILWEYAGQTAADVGRRVISVAYRNENYCGSLRLRLEKLEWEIKKFKASPSE